MILVQVMAQLTWVEYNEKALGNQVYGNEL